MAKLVITDYSQRYFSHLHIKPMSDSTPKTPIGFEQPMLLKKMYFGFVCVFCGLISLLIFNLDNYETWLSIPMALLLVVYYYYLTLNISNLYKYGDSIIVEHAIKGEFTFDKNELTDVKSNLFFDNIYFNEIKFSIFHSSGYTRASFLAGEKEYEQKIKQILLE